MTPLVPITLFAYVPVVLLLFALLSPRQAVIVAMLAGFLFLPEAGYEFRGLPAYTKISAISVGPILGVALFDWHRIASFRPRLLDLPMAVWCLCPLFSSLSNGLGIYDGLSGVLTQMFRWGIPFFLGRLYLSDLQGLRYLAVGVLIGGLLYVPLCLYEFRMSPQLNSMLYGFRPRHRFPQMRFGGYRPSVFLETGLTLGLWMGMSSLIGVWLWVCGAARRLLGMPMAVLIPVLLITTVLCRSAGAMALLLLGLAVLHATKWARMRAPVIALIAIGPLFMAGRASGLWSGDELVSVASVFVGAERGASLEYRLANDDALAKKALERPLCGWGGWGRSRLHDERGKTSAATDGWWIIALGQNGLIGLASMSMAFLLPVAVLIWRCPPSTWDV